VLVLSMHGEADDVRRAFEAGARGYVLKTAVDEELIRAIRVVSSGELYLHPSLGAVLAQPPPPRGAVDELSPRERDVLRLLALGHTNQEIAQELYVSVRTVESHRAHIMTKLRAASRAEMVRHAIAGGLLDEAT
jgi:two-component system response regulator NreC